MPTERTMAYSGHITTFAITAALSLGLLAAQACGGDDGGSDTANDSGNDSAGDSVGDTAAVTGDAGGDDASADDGAGSDAPADSSGDGSMGACELLDDEDECGMCVKGSCCPELEACKADEACTCFRDCAMKIGMDMALECSMMCDVSLLDTATPTGALGQCTLAECPVCLEE